MEPASHEYYRQSSTPGRRPCNTNSIWSVQKQAAVQSRVGPVRVDTWEGGHVAKWCRQDSENTRVQTAHWFCESFCTKPEVS